MIDLRVINFEDKLSIYGIFLPKNINDLRNINLTKILSKRNIKVLSSESILAFKYKGLRNHEFLVWLHSKKYYKKIRLNVQPLYLKRQISLFMTLNPSLPPIQKTPQYINL